jgi:hypothetical protein
MNVSFDRSGSSTVIAVQNGMLCEVITRALHDEIQNLIIMPETLHASKRSWRFALLMTHYVHQYEAVRFDENLLSMVVYHYTEKASQLFAPVTSNVFIRRQEPISDNYGGTL